MFGDGHCAAVHPFLLLSWILLLFAFVTSLCIWHFTTVRTCLPTFPLNSQELAESSSSARVSTCLHHSLNLPASSLFSHCPHVTTSTGVLHLFAFPSLTRSVDTQVSKSRFVTEGFICTLGAHGPWPVPAISSTVSNRSLTYMPSMTQCKRSFDSTPQSNFMRT